MDTVELLVDIVWAVNYGCISVSASSFGLIKNALNAKQINTMPPTMVTEIGKNIGRLRFLFRFDFPIRFRI